MSRARYARSSGAAATYMEYRYPVVVGSDVSGTVAEVGALVEDIAVGDRVFGLLRERVAGRGTFAEYVAFPRAWIAPTPSVVSPSDAGVLAALTYFRMVIVPGKKGPGGMEPVG